MSIERVGALLVIAGVGGCIAGSGAESRGLATTSAAAAAIGFVLFMIGRFLR